MSAGATLPRLGVYARSLPAPPAGGTWSLTGSRRCPRSMTPITGAARPRLRAGPWSGKGSLAACGGKGAPVRGPFGGPRPTRPLRPAGRHPAHPGRRRGAARPACCRSRGHVAAKAAPLARPGQVGRQPLRGGTPPQSKAKASRLRRALLCSSPAPVAAQVLRGGPAPTVWGLWGRPPLRPRPAGGRSGPPPLAACGSQAGAAAAACGLAPAGGRNFNAARKGRNALRAFAPYRAWRAAGARGYARCGGVSDRRSDAKAKPLRGRLQRALT